MFLIILLMLSLSIVMFSPNRIINGQQLRRENDMTDGLLEFQNLNLNKNIYDDELVPQYNFIFHMLVV